MLEPAHFRVEDIRRMSGLCTRCGRRRPLKGVSCDPCKTRMREYARAKKVARILRRLGLLLLVPSSLLIAGGLLS